MTQRSRRRGYRLEFSADNERNVFHLPKQLNSPCFLSLNERLIPLSGSERLLNTGLVLPSQSLFGIGLGLQENAAKHLLGSLLVVFLRPFFDDDAGVQQASESVLSETLTVRAGVESLDAVVLTGFAWLNQAQATPRACAAQA